MNKSLRERIAAAATAAALTALTACGSTEPHTPPTQPSAPADQAGFGYAQIRKAVKDSTARFTVTSPDFRDGEALPADTWAGTFGCTGANRQVDLTWTGAPQGTRSYAITMFDPDAPTGSGFWHWVVRDIPSDRTSTETAFTSGAITGTSDAGQPGYLGPCPPNGDLQHRYEFTVHALDVPTLELPASASPAVTSFTMSSHVIGYARITGTARR
ncbi:YbhB/YbcL family Raf kinase inhibitor-like protein [Lentzea sp. HUAS12]|uniref:YbhB/YbcL family Raf kinase inhibitor-like protein n=1 Tax=Lentzea sp. HUAS12 TaxID=2951806 RepID=UPI00209E5861|nr:YbhB/YbcL family Raf kinase inhibitor-like protein [Lentzea sp. HUAS12]USX54036.1 YbhB/YbcL family Raf kinase inhibitor-like protein [Lentzea sp. HUAS12]